ncbi:hypothetical protein [Pseudomonas serbica]|uniref:hypothetical protein n=1 Tax=Pseudomonas serbica TaxID=2965074 RepID=UPI00237C3D82|nr:hypothetical protein [Pseudomonas serbica]
MRIPVSFADHDRLFASQIQSVRDSLHELRGEDAFYPDLFAKVMGYQNYDELLSARVEDIHVHSQFQVTRSSLLEAMTWNAFSQGVCGYLQATKVVGSLELERFDCDLLTRETRAANAVLGVKNFRPGKVLFGGATNNPFASPNTPLGLILDEFPSYKDTWLKQTPELIEAGAPPYKSSILPNGLAFCWKRLTSMVGALPDDLDEQLANVALYDKLPDPKSRRLKFWQDEIILHNFEPAWVYARRTYKLPEGFEIICNQERWYLYNKVLMGFIPLSFKADSQAFYKAVVMILCGQPIVFAENELGPADERGFQEVLLTDPIESGDERSELRMRGRQVANLLVKADELFFENWQPYLRSQQWITPSGIPAGLADVCASKTLMPNRLSPQVLPTWGMEFADALRKEFAGTVQSASQRLRESLGRGDLVKLTAALLTFSCIDLDRYATSKRQFWYPLAGDREALESALEQYQLAGTCIQKAFPELSGLSVITLGILHCECEYAFINKDCTDFPNFDPTNTEQLVRFLSYVILLLSASMTQPVHQSDLRNQQAMTFAVSVLSEAVSKSKAGMTLSQLEMSTLVSMNIHRVYASTCDFMQRLQWHDTFVERVREWHASNDAMKLIRQKGDYLFADEKVPLQRPVAVSELFDLARGGHLANQTAVINLETCAVTLMPTVPAEGQV